ncbi:sterol desaturase family protein [Phenylobacterium montanum]|uniref:Sterol desaturase family protein n=1 Tax=Phenylobacterium montanum TaxID=2823693 RepID=A0A975FZ10_9CAUL|nr:sterol desaturase family protein [Caulobacter sp. S6]QUD87462.1 sterol desaturase family protein [Caulobacter sp. S6]
MRNAILSGFLIYLALGAAVSWGIERLTPDTLRLAIGGHVATLTQLHRRIFATAAVMVLVIPAIFVLELCFVGWRRSSMRLLLIDHPRSSLSDLVCFLGWQGRIMSALTVVMSLGVALVSGAWLHQQLAAAIGFDLTLAHLPPAVQFAGYFVLFSFFDYWGHRLDHTHWFWPLHRFHHAAEDFCVLNSVRTHPAVFTDLVAVVTPAVICGVQPETLVQVNFFVLVLRYLIHSRIDSTWGFVGRWLLQSPNHHRLHHILDLSVPVGHFALVPLWDRLFGTWRGDADQSLVIGVETPYRHGAWIGPDLWRDYRDFWAGLLPARSAVKPAAAAAGQIGVEG